MRINTEDRNILVDLARDYDTWLNAARLACDRLRWKKVAGKAYLYRILDSAGNATSLGPRNPDTERRFAAFEQALRSRDAAAERIARRAAVCTTSRLPAFAGRVLRELDLRGLLGSSYLVVGVNALPAYAAEAGMLPSAVAAATERCDLAWSQPMLAMSAPQPPNSLFAALRRVDRTCKIDVERPARVRSGKGDVVQLYLAAALADGWSPREQIRPTRLREQYWLLQGRPVAQIVPDTDNNAARIAAPDPRWFALHRLWLSQQPTRLRSKGEMDERLGMAVLDMVADHMPHFPIDADFEGTLPAALRPHLERWGDCRKPAAA